MTDTHNPGGRASLTFEFLATCRDASALRILVGALEEPSVAIKRRAVKALLLRHHRVGLQALVRAFHTLGPASDLLADRFDDLAPAVRGSIRDAWPQARRNAVDLVRRYGGPPFAYLLGEALADPEAAVREAAATTLAAWARETAAAWEASRDAPAARAEAVGPRSALLAALWETFRTFDRHGAPDVLTGLIHLDSQQLARALYQIGSPRDPRATAALDLVRSTDEPEVAAFAYALLAHPGLAAAAARVVAERDDTAFVTGLLDGVSALEPTATNGRGPMPGALERLQRVTHVAWLEPGRLAAMALSPERLSALVRFVSATGLSPAAQGEVLCRLLGRTPAAGRLAMVEAAERLPPEAARAVVQAALLDEDEAVQTAATHVVLRTRWPDRDRLLIGRLASPFETVRHLAIRELSRYSFQRYLEAFDELDQTTRELAGRAVQRIDDRMLDHLADELHALYPRRRFRALQVVQTLHLEPELAPHLIALLADPDRVVRATVVKVLGVVRTLEAMQAIIAALGDPDERVKANAIEVLEAVRSERFVGLLEPFLRHPNNRVRANAAKALIHLNYGPAREVLLGMLDDPAERMRLSAVWTLSQTSLAGAAEPPDDGEQAKPARGLVADDDEPSDGIIDRLERLTREDASPRVRARAQEALAALRR